MASRRATRSAVGGWVENSLAMPAPPLKGFEMNRWAVEGLVVAGAVPREYASILRSALASASGSAVRLAPEESAPNSRLRDTAIWITRAAIGPRITRASSASGLRSLSPPPSGMNHARRDRKMIIAPMVAATDEIRMYRFLTWDSS